MTHLVIKRIYDPIHSTDGYRILVDRIWPRGVSKEAAQIDEWNKIVAPSTALRKWFNHEPEKWQEFTIQYINELKANNTAAMFWEAHKEKEKITLVYAAKDKEHCHPLILMEYLKTFLEKEYKPKN